MLSRAMQAQVEVMLVDCAIAVGRGVGTKKVSLAAARLWAKAYSRSFSEALLSAADYESDRKVVVLMGVKLGRKARQLAGTKKEIGKAEAKKASKLINLDKACGADGPKYCPLGNFDL